LERTLPRPAFVSFENCCSEVFQSRCRWWRDFDFVR